MHRRHHNRNRQRTSIVAAFLALAACTPTTRPDPPGPLGALTERWPAPTIVDASGPYGDPLADPVPPLLTQAIADELVAPGLRKGLDGQARASLAQASESAASRFTGESVLWQSADASGAVMPIRNAYRSHRGDICRDLQQQAKTKSGPSVSQITLCHADLADGRMLWLPGSPD